MTIKEIIIEIFPIVALILFAGWFISALGDLEKEEKIFSNVLVIFIIVSFVSLIIIEVIEKI